MRICDVVCVCVCVVVADVAIVVVAVVIVVVCCICAGAVYVCACVLVVYARACVRLVVCVCVREREYMYVCARVCVSGCVAALLCAPNTFEIGAAHLGDGKDCCKRQLAVLGGLEHRTAVVGSVKRGEGEG